LRRRWRVHGVVQGVGYRYFAVQTARRARLCGFARNLPDGAVEVEAEGGEDELRHFLEELTQGPAAARVERIEQQEPTTDPLPFPFTVAY
jgi:acylphosphatase